MKKLTLILVMILIMVSCADSKEFTINGKKEIVEPYGWFDTTEKNDSIEYRINPGNIVLDIVFCETLIVPIILTDAEFYEPVRKK